MSQKVSRGSQFVLEKIRERSDKSSIEEIELASRSLTWISTFFHQLDNWVLNHVETQMFGVGRAFSFIARIPKYKTEINFSCEVEGDWPHVTLRIGVKGNRDLVYMVGLNDFESARRLGRFAMEKLNERKYKKYR